MRIYRMVLMLSLAISFLHTQAQNGGKDYFVGKWELIFKGTPNGDAKLHADLVRTEGKLGGMLKDPSSSTEPIQITNIEEKEDALVIYFTAQGYDVSVDLKKVDDNKLTGSLLNMFDAVATRLQDDFFAGKWEITFLGTPNGDGKLLTDLIRQEGKLTGELKDPSGQIDPIKITRIDEIENGIEIFFTAQGYDVSVILNKVDNDNLKGSLINMFDAKAARIKN